MTARILSNVFRKYFRLVLFLLTITLATPVSAQKQKADKLYGNRDYYAAARAYEKEANNETGKKRSGIQSRIGTCYLKINQPQKALPWLQQAIAEGMADGDTWYRYGLALQQTNQYHKAIHAFEQCLKIQAGHPLAGAKIASCRFALSNGHINPHTNFRLATEVNTAGGEFGISLYNNMVYYSVAGTPVNESDIDPRTGLHYVETFNARLHNARLINPQVAGSALPGYVSDGLFACDSIARCAYFSYCDDNNRCGIFFSELRNGKWTKPEIVLLNKKNQVTGHPAIANGGNRLYFTSNSPEGIGQTDIWYIDRIDGKWRQAVNAGNVINTFGREEFPFVYADSLLFFASDGHAGYGGLDIFCSVIRDNTLTQPVNLRRPYNSQGDDFNLVISGNTGLLSSSRNESVSDDIYLFEGIPSLLYVSGNVADASTGAGIGNARLTLSVDGKAVQQTVSDSTGRYGIFLEKDEAPMMYVRATGYKPSLTDIILPGVSQFTDFQRDIQLQLSTVLPVTVSLYDKITGRPVTERGIICFNNDGETQIMRTDIDGAFRFTMQEDQKEYWIKFPDGYYLTESILLNEEQRTYSLGVQPLSEELFSGWLLFKKGSNELIEMSQPLILRIADVIKANPGTVFRITGFCDTVTESGQPNLAGQRAEYIMRRMVECGVDKRQLTVATGNPAVKGSTIDEETSAYQRRVEIRVKR